MRVLTVKSVLVIAALALASPARAEDARETARRVMHEALAERATLPVRPPLMPERAATDAARAREQAATATAGAAHASQSAAKHGPQDARHWRTDAANRAAAGAAAGHGEMMRSGTEHQGSSDCADAAGMMRTTGHDPHGGTMPGGGMMPGGMDGMPGHH